MIAELAERQHGVMSRRQLLAAGVSDRMIRRRLALKRLRQMHAGVYEVGGGKRDQSAVFMAAVLACGDTAVLSHRSAAALSDLRPQRTRPVDVSVTGAGGRRREGIRLHTPRHLPPDEVTTVEGIACTSVPRTLIDLADVLPERDVGRALERSLVLRVFDMGAMEAALARSNGRRGVRALRRLLDTVADDPPPTRSEFERRFLDLISDASLPRPVTNGHVCGYEVDFHWPDAKLIVETDGATTHDTAIAFHRDRRRDLDLELADWHVIRITWRQLRDEPAKVVALLRRRL